MSCGALSAERLALIQGRGQSPSLKKLHHGAFQKIVDYDPQRVLSRLTKRLFDKYRQDKMKDKGQASVKMVELSRDV